jgi:hypothetical protein
MQLRSRGLPSLANSAIYVMNPDGSGLRQLLTLAGPPCGAAGLSASGNAGPRQFLARHLQGIETGGVDPQWGPAPQ